MKQYWFACSKIQIENLYWRIPTITTIIPQLNKRLCSVPLLPITAIQVICSNNLMWFDIDEKYLTDYLRKKTLVRSFRTEKLAAEHLKYKHQVKDDFGEFSQDGSKNFEEHDPHTMHLTDGVYLNYVCWIFPDMLPVLGLRLNVHLHCTEGKRVEKRTLKYLETIYWYELLEKWLITWYSYNDKKRR